MNQSEFQWVSPPRRNSDNQTQIIIFQHEIGHPNNIVSNLLIFPTGEHTGYWPYHMGLRVITVERKIFSVLTS